MEQRIIERYSEAILHEAMRRYGIGAEQIRPIKAYESFIYQVDREPAGSILRISHSLRRSEALIAGEADWINFLAAGGVSVARALRSEGGALVEPIDDGQGGQFLATNFSKAAGQPPWDIWTPELYTSYGRLLGQMHALAQRYQPADPAWRRPEWDSPGMQFVDLYLPASQTLAHARYRELLTHLSALPRGPADYGLIHQDAHGGNFLVDAAGTITLFDFDDCAYSWFASDIAIALFYIVMDAEDWPAFTRAFLQAFLRGYRTANRLDPRWLREIPAFLKLRELELYAVVHRDFDIDAIGDWWIARFMQGRKQRIEQGLPFIEFDFAELEDLLR